MTCKEQSWLTNTKNYPPSSLPIPPHMIFNVSLRIKQNSSIFHVSPLPARPSSFLDFGFWVCLGAQPIHTLHHPFARLAVAVLEVEFSIFDFVQPQRVEQLLLAHGPGTIFLEAKKTENSKYAFIWRIWSKVLWIWDGSIPRTTFIVAHAEICCEHVTKNSNEWSSLLGDWGDSRRGQTLVATTSNSELRISGSLNAHTPVSLRWDSEFRFVDVSLRFA